MKKLSNFYPLIFFFLLFLFSCSDKTSKQEWVINDQEYFEAPGLSVLVFHNFYPGGKQGGVEIIQHGERIATNGFIRMERVPGRRFSYPEQATRVVDPEKKIISAKVSYEDFDFSYTVRVWPDGENIRLAVDLNKPIPSEWENKLSFAIEFFPPLYFGKTFQLGDGFGIIPRQGNGPLIDDGDGNLAAVPLAQGKVLTLAGEDPLRQVVVENLNGELSLVDERNYAGRGWVWIKSTIPSGVSENAIEWKIKANSIPGWYRAPMIAISQVGYHPAQVKQAIIELDARVSQLTNARLLKLDGDKTLKEVLSAMPAKWGKFLCYNYVTFDFSEVKDPGMYIVNYEGEYTNPFSINEDVFRRDVWQPTLENYFPLQMCHMKIKDLATIWHGACHLDDALQAPLDIEHVDGYHQYTETETKYAPMTPVPFLNQGGWHDAGDDDLAAGSQAATTHYLVLADEISDIHPDQTTVDYENLLVEMRRPDGIPDFVQQVKHGAINLLSGYRVAGHSFAGIITNRKERNMIGDLASISDQLFYDSRLGPKQKTTTTSGIPDDRLVFTNKDTGLEYEVSAALAAASRNLRGYDDALARECLETAIKAWKYEQSHDPVLKPNAYVPRNTKQEEILSTVELLYTTKEEIYAAHLIKLLPDIKKNIRGSAWGIARVIDQINNEEFKEGYMEALKEYKIKLDSTLAATPFGVPWRPRIWGIGWDIQQFALEHYFLVTKYPDMFDRELILRVVNYVLGCHPGSSTSLVSGVGAHSLTTAFGVNRYDWFYIPGGMASGTALIRPDFPELKEPFPYLWQQTEYVMPGAGSYIFCVVAADRLLNK